MKSNKYWEQRFEQLNEALMNKGAAYAHNLEKQFNTAIKSTEKDLSKWYARLAVNNEVSMQEAKRMLTTNELEEFRWDVEDYIKYGKENELNQKWIKQLENASARWHISRLEAMKIQMQNHVEALYGSQEDEFTDLMTDIYYEGYYRSIFEVQKGFEIGANFARLDDKQIEKVLSRPWAADGSNFSDRIWKQKAQLVSELNNQLSQMIIRGQSPDKAIAAISKRFEVSKKQAGRLVMTEAAYFASESRLDSLKTLGVKEYEIVATLDRRTSEVCQALDGQHLPLSEYKAGVTAPPFHVWCRTTTVPYFDDDEFEQDMERAARDSDDGKTYRVPANMKYPEWYKKHVANSGKSSKFTLSSPIRPKENDFDSSDEYETAKNQYRATRDEYRRELEEYTDNYYNSIEERFATYEEFQDYLQNNGFIHQTIDTLTQDGGIDFKAMSEFANAYDLTKSKVPKLVDHMDFVSLDATKATTADAWTYSLGDIHLSKKYAKGAFKDHLYDISDAVARKHFVDMNIPSYHDIIHELGHNAEEYISSIIGGSNGKIAGNNSLWSEIAKEFNVSTHDELISKYPISDYGTENIHEWFAETFTGYIDGASTAQGCVKLGKILEKYLR